MPAISVILPVYNSGEVLHRTIKSIIGQSFRDFELLIIDDGSNDGVSPAICDEYAGAYNYIKVYHGPNEGVSGARNRGISLAQGEYLMFIDGDDWVESDILEKFYAKAPADYIACRAEGKDIQCFRDKTYIRGEVDNLFNMVRQKCFYTVWAKLYKKSILDEYGLRFDRKLFLAEDTMFIYNYLAHCDSVAILGKPYDHYTGVWGGTTERYGYGLEKAQYMVRTGYEALQAISEHWGQPLPYHRRLAYMNHVQGLYSKYTDADICKAFRECCPSISEDQYYNCSGLCQSRNGLRMLKKLWRKGKKEEALALAKDLHNHFTQPTSRLGLKPHYRLLYALVRTENYRGLRVVLPLVCRL